MTSSTARLPVLLPPGPGAGSAASRGGRFAAPVTFALFGLEGPPSMYVALAVVRDGVYFNDQSEGSTDGRIRRATVQWKR